MDLIDNHPRTIEHREKLADVEARNKTAMERRAKAWTKHETDLAAWRQKVADANDAGKTPPPEPATPDVSGENQILANNEARRRMLGDEWNPLLISIQPEIEEQARAWVEELRVEVARHAAALEGLLRTINGVRADVGACRDAVRNRARSHAVAGDLGPLPPAPVRNVAELLMLARGADLLTTAAAEPGRVMAATSHVGGLTHLEIGGQSVASFADVEGKPHREPQVPEYTGPWWR